MPGMWKVTMPLPNAKSPGPRPASACGRIVTARCQCPVPAGVNAHGLSNSQPCALAMLGAAPIGKGFRCLVIQSRRADAGRTAGATRMQITNQIHWTRTD